MRHRVKTSIFNRSTNHRKAMLAGLVRNLFEHGELETTQAKAKEIKRWADKLIATAQENSLASKRKLHEFFGKRDVVNTIVEVIVPAVGDRKSGFTTIETTGIRRGDSALMSKLSLVNKPANLNSFNKSEQKAKDNKNEK